MSIVLAHSAVEYEPGWHDWHSDGVLSPSVLLYVPGRQEAQALAPSAGAKLPLTHLVHTEAVSAPLAGLYVPFVHMVQLL